MSYLVSNFYKFHPLEADKLGEIQKFLKTEGRAQQIRGLFLIGTEGVNATISGTTERVAQYKKIIESVFGEILYKDNQCEYLPFKNFQVKIRKEIVSLNRTDIIPSDKKHNHLTPEEWHQMMEQSDVVVLDTRNWYEYDMGKFKTAIHFNIDEFNQFPERFEKSNLDKNKKLMIYCTGGIRCEKAIYQIEEQGFKNVYQLDGGILKYLEKFPHQKFEGECFVFDRRCAVDQNLQPSEKYAFCPHCGQPAAHPINCIRCNKDAKVCEKCLKQDTYLSTCSKNCAHHTKRGSRLKTRQQTLTRQERHKEIVEKFKRT